MMVETVVMVEAPPGPAGGTGRVIAMKPLGVKTKTVPGTDPDGATVDTVVGPVRTPVPV